MMLASRIARAAKPAFGMVRMLGTTAQPSQPAFTWAEQDHWEDPRGPLGIERPSPKLAPLTSQSPQWLHDLHRNGVSMFALNNAREY